MTCGLFDQWSSVSVTQISSAKHGWTDPGPVLGRDSWGHMERRFRMPTDLMRSLPNYFGPSLALRPMCMLHGNRCCNIFSLSRRVGLHFAVLIDILGIFSSDFLAFLVYFRFRFFLGHGAMLLIQVCLSNTARMFTNDKCAICTADDSPRSRSVAQCRVNYINIHVILGAESDLP